MGEVPRLPEAHCRQQPASRWQAHGRGTPAKLRHQPRREDAQCARAADDWLGRDARGRPRAQCHRDVVARRGGRHRGSASAPPRNHDAEHLSLFRLLSDQGRGQRARGYRRLSAARPRVWLRTDAARALARRAEVYHRRAGQPLERIHADLPPDGVHGTPAHGGSRRNTMGAA